MPLTISFVHSPVSLCTDACLTNLSQGQLIYLFIFSAITTLAKSIPTLNLFMASWQYVQVESSTPEEVTAYVLGHQVLDPEVPFRVLLSL